MSINTGATITYGTDEYVVYELIKRGGFGKVFRARQVKPIVRDIALKVPRDEIVTDPVWSKKFAREARILANISHRNVVRIVAFFTFPDGTMALAQEMVSGAQELHSFIKAFPERAASVVLQALYALRAIHGTGGEAAIHRDLSPSNVLVDTHGVVKIIDFGLAKEDPRMTEILTRADEGFGTHGCIAPEQMLGAAHVDPRADLFALGQSIAAALQGRHPLHARPDKLPEPWRTLCVKLTEHDPSDRYQSAEEALDAALRGFASTSISLTEFDVHVEEMQARPVMPAWSASCDHYFRSLPDISHGDLALARRLGDAVFDPSDCLIDANAILEKIQTSSALASFEHNQASFDDCDPFGWTLASLYKMLSVDNKLVCFRRLARTAVQWHRYALMGNVRYVYSTESDQNVKAQLLQLLKEEDPSQVIEGRGVIPGR